MCDLHKTILLELELVHKNDITFVAMGTMTFQHDRYFGIQTLLEKKPGYPHFLFNEMFSSSIIDNLKEFRKICRTIFILKNNKHDYP